MFNQNLSSWIISPGCLQTTWPGTGIHTLKIQRSGGYPQERLFLPTEMTIRLGEHGLTVWIQVHRTLLTVSCQIPFFHTKRIPETFPQDRHLPNMKKFSLGAVPRLDIHLVRYHKLLSLGLLNLSSDTRTVTACQNIQRSNTPNAQQVQCCDSFFVSYRTIHLLQLLIYILNMLNL